MLLCYSVLFSVRISFFSRMSKGIFWQVHPSMQRRMTTWRLAAKASHGRPASSRRSSGLKHIIPLQSTHHNLTAFQEGFRIVSAILSTTVHTQYTRSGNSGERYKCPGGTSDSPPRASALPAPSLRYAPMPGRAAGSWDAGDAGNPLCLRFHPKGRGAAAAATGPPLRGRSDGQRRARRGARGWIGGRDGRPAARRARRARGCGRSPRDCWFARTGGGRRLPAGGRRCGGCPVLVCHPWRVRRA